MHVANSVHDVFSSLSWPPAKQVAAWILVCVDLSIMSINVHVRVSVLPIRPGARLSSSFTASVLPIRPGARLSSSCLVLIDGIVSLQLFVSYCFTLTSQVGRAEMT